jgi:hypothetical protein
MNADLKRMAAAHAKVAETWAALSAAIKAETAAQTLLDGIEMELAKHSRRNKELASERAGKLMAALKLGDSAPAFKKKGVSLANDHLAVMEAEHRRDAARIAVEKLGAEVSAATAAHDAAKDAVGIEARAILAKEAEGHAARIAEIEREAFQHRIQLEGAHRSGAFGYRPSGLSDLSRRILSENNSLPLGVRNAEPWVAANASAEDWRQRLSKLLDPALSA